MMGTCPVCLGQIEAADSFCRRCGVDLRPGEASLYVQGVDALYSLLLRFSPSERLSTSSRRPKCITEQVAAEGYALLGTAVLIVLLVLSPAHTSPFGIAVVTLATIRWIEIQTFGLGLLFKKREMSTAGVISIAVAGAGLSLTSAIWTRVLANEPSDWVTSVPASPFSAWYSSATNLVVLGNGHFVPASWPAELIVVVTGASGVALLAVYLARTVSMLR
jgi:hypothetical protein